MILKNCYIYDDEIDDEYYANIYIKDGKIFKKEKYENNPMENIPSMNINSIDDNKLSEETVIDLNGYILVPGGIDPHVHFDTPGYTEREDFYHGSMSALAGGITTVIDMPCTSIPEVINHDNLIEKLKVVKEQSVVDYAFYGGVNGLSFEKSIERFMDELKEDGVRGFKIYFISGMKTYPRVDNYQYYKILEKAKSLKLPVLIHAEDYELITHMTEVEMKKGNDYINYYNSRFELCEMLAVRNAIEIAKYVKGDIHIVHVGSIKAAEYIVNEKNYGNFKISFETCPHFLFFTYKDFEIKGGALKTAPVVKNDYDKNGLWEMIKQNKVDFISSDHAPSSFKEKNTGSAWTDYGGIPGVQTLIPSIFSEGVVKRNLTLKQFVNLTSENAAKRYKLYPKKGSLSINSDADFAIIDPESIYTFKKEMLLSKGETTPFDGETFNGKVIATFLRGKLAYQKDKGILIKPGEGKYLDFYVNE